MFICLSPGGQSITQGETPKEKLLVGTVDGIFAFHKRNGSWEGQGTMVPGKHFSSIIFEPVTQTLLGGTHSGEIYASADHGQTWELNRPLWDDPRREEWFGGGADFPGIHSVCVDPRDPQRIILGISCGGAWITRDGGRTWSPGGKGMRAEYMPPERAYDENVQDPHLVAMCQHQPDALWVQHHNGIFKSTDGAASWSEIQNVQPSAFGFAVAVHPRNPEIACVCAARPGHPARNRGPGEWYRTNRYNRSHPALSGRFSSCR